MSEKIEFSSNHLSLWNSGLQAISTDVPLYVARQSGERTRLDPEEWDIKLIATKKVKPLKVGDVIEDRSSLLEVAPADTGAVDRDGDLWQKRVGLWYCTDHETSERYSDSLLADFGPLTIVYIPSPDLDC